MSKNGSKDLEELTLQDLAQMLWRQRIIIVVVTLAAVVAGGLYGALLSPVETMYSNHAVVDQDAYNVNNYVLEETLDSSLVEEIAENYQSGSTLQATFELEVVQEAELIRIQARGEDEQELNSFLKNMGLEIVDMARDIRLRALDFEISNYQRAVDRIDSQIMQHLGEASGEEIDQVSPRDFYQMLDEDADILLESLFESRAEKMSELMEKEAVRDYILEEETTMAEKDMVMVQSAEAAPHYAMGTPRTNVVLAGLIGLALSCFIAILRERLRTS